MVKVALVYTWVNAADDRLGAQRAHYKSLETGGDIEYRAGASRYADRGELKASISSALKFAPFIDRIVIVGAGAPPSWLPVESSIIGYVDQDVILPEGASPLFQSDAVEAYLYRIDGLSEHYLYANDDYFFARPHLAELFFPSAGAEPCRISITHTFMGVGEVAGTYRSMEINSLRALKRIGLPRFVDFSNTGKLHILSHRRARLEAAYLGVPLLNRTSHVVQPYRKSYWGKFHEIFANEIKSLCGRKFRSQEGYAVNLMYHHYLRSLSQAEFYYEPRHAYLDWRSSPEERASLMRSLSGKSDEVTRFVLNDHPGCEDGGWETYLAAVLAAI